MNAIHPLAAVAELIGEPARAAILLELADGRARSAGELARASAISAPSASGHLAKLLLGGLVLVKSEGRHRWYRLAGAGVGHALEALGAIATRPPRLGALRRPGTDPLHELRSCYDHLAGRVAVELARSLEASRVLRPRGERDYGLEPRGRAFFGRLGVDTESLRASRRAFARRCLDWTERRPHVAGALGAALLSRLVDLGWVARRPDTRALRVTVRGRRELSDRFGIAVCA
jgi:DNA-binding transcriptional ArsR family regulator